MIVQIAICDDEKIFLEELVRKVSEQFSTADIEYNIKTYTDGTKLLSDCDNMTFDVMFLDIEMPQVTGIEVADRIRAYNPFVMIVFITNCDELVFQSIKYRPFRFIRKHFIKEEFPEAIQAIAQKLKNENQYYCVCLNGSQKEIRIVDIMFIESYKHDIFIHTVDEKYRIKSNLSKLEKQFEVFGFIRVHSGYIVNFRYIFSVDKTKVILNNRNEIPLSRYRAETVKQKLQCYARGAEK
jgi:DNA-binding LytR/AlgR family response regulator